jgi:cytochrome c oxidase subunit 2
VRAQVTGMAELVAILVVLTSCSGNHAVLSAHGPDAARTEALSWFMIVLATVITLFVFALLVVGLFGDGTVRERFFTDRRLVLGGGIVLPTVVLLLLSGLTVAALRSDPASANGDLAITVVGHQYWWEVHYPGASVVTANEIHVPVGREVRFTLESDDVIHSFWLPALGGKTDMIPGHVNHMTLRADTPGSYRGQCAEFCGLQHAHMAFLVVAQTPAAFRHWLQQQASPAAPPTGHDATAGRAAFLSQPCAGCHQVRGTTATSTVGPDLTHLASRSTIGALMVPNDTAHLQRWIVDAPAIKPGIHMPPVPLTPVQTRDIVAYLDQLR